MTEHHIIYSVAGIRIAVRSQVPFMPAEKCLPFLSEGKPDVTVVMQQNSCDDLTGYQQIFSGQEYDILQRGDEIIKVKYLSAQKETLAWILRHPQKQNYILDFRPCWEQHLQHINPLFFFELSGFLIDNDAMILHSSVIACAGRGIVFTAPSGTGKSTQAELWHKYRGADILNGDRTILRRQNNHYYGWGSPYAGSSNIFKNESVPLAAIVVLRQAPANSIHRLNMREACLYLLSEMSISGWNKNVVERQTDWMIHLLETIPVYRLDCLPDQSAVDLLSATLGGF